MRTGRACLALAVVTFAVAFTAPGCGGGAGEAGPQVTPAPDRSGRIAALKRKLARLKERNRRAQERADRTRERSGRTVTNGAGDLDTLVAGLPGQAGVVVSAPGGSGRQAVGGSLTGGPAWSTIKVPIAERVLEDGGGPDGIGPDAVSQITAAITLSDNEAAAALFDRLENAHGGLAGASDAVGETLRAAGDSATLISTQGRDGFSTYGQTEWSLAEQNRYMAALAGGCISDPASRDFLLGRMGQVKGSDTFGLGSTGLPARWKGGWGPGTDGRYLVRQMGVVDAGNGPVVLAMAAVPDDGTFSTGGSMLDELAARVIARYGPRPLPPASC